MELTKVPGSIWHVEGDAEDLVMALWRMENEARDTTATRLRREPRKPDLGRV